MKTAKYLVIFKGNNNTWNTIMTMTEREAAYMKADGLEVYEFLYIWPDWVEEWGLAGVWMFAADVFNFRNPFRSRKKDVQ